MKKTLKFKTNIYVSEILLQILFNCSVILIYVDNILEIQIFIFISFIFISINY